jgi:hypothetical protein
MCGRPDLIVPTVLRWKGYRFFFWSGDRGEPPHIHVRRGAGEAKLWLDEVAVATAVGLADHELNEILRKVRERRTELRRAWDEHFGHREA